MIIGVAIFRAPSFTEDHPANGWIVESALKAPKRHHDCIHEIFQRTGQSVPGDWIQGFYTDKGAMLDRKEALRYVYRIGQLNPKDKLGCEGLLFSEDLW